MIRTLSKFAALLILAGILGSTPVRADDPPPTDGGQDPPHHPGIVQLPATGLDVLVEAWAALLTTVAL